MRFRIPMRRIVLFLSLAPIALIAFLPLRLAIGGAGSMLTAREVTGSVWSGTLKEARLGPLALGDLSAGLAPLDLLFGRARFDLRRTTEGAEALSGSIVASLRRRSVESANGMVQLESGLADLPVRSVTLYDVGIRFKDGLCDSADGQVSVALSGAGLPTQAAGPIRCDRGAVLIMLRGGTGPGFIVHIFGDGRIEAAPR